MKTDQKVKIIKDCEFKGTFCRIVEIDRDKGIVSAYVFEAENVLNFNIEGDLAFGNKKKNCIPKSRKDFYQFIQNSNTTKTDIVETIKLMQSLKLFNMKEKEEGNTDEPLMCSSGLFDFIMDEDSTKYVIVQNIRAWRDQGFIEFKLDPNSLGSKPIVKRYRHNKNHNS